MCLSGDLLWPRWFATSILSSYTGNSLLDYTLAAPVRCAHQRQRSGGSLRSDRSHASSPRVGNGEANRQRIRHENPIPLDKIAGTVDVYPHRQDVVFAYDLNYDPRPVVSSLVATSTTLADVNARSLCAGPSRAAERFLFDIELVDENYPTMLDGESLPELLTRYDVIDGTGALLVLRRASTPRTYGFTPMQTLHGRFNEAIPIPSASGAPIWAPAIRFKKRTLPDASIPAALQTGDGLEIAVHTTT